MVLLRISFLLRRKSTQSFRPFSVNVSKESSFLNCFRWFFTAANFSQVASVQSFCFPHSLTNSSNASQKLVLGSSAISCSVAGASFILALKLSFICAGVGSTFCTSNSLKMFCISVYCLSRSALISDALCFSLFVHPFFTLCLSASHLAVSMRQPVVNSMRWLANITRIRIGTFSVIGTPFFFRLSSAKMMFLLIFIIGCV